jgi:hypothetical protein
VEEVVAAVEALTEEEAVEEVMEEAAMAVAAEVVAEDTGRLKDKISEERSMWAYFFVQIFVSSNPNDHTLLL